MGLNSSAVNGWGPTGPSTTGSLEAAQETNSGRIATINQAAKRFYIGFRLPDVLFVNDLWLFGSSDLIISNNTVLYFVNSNNWSVAQVTLLGNGEIHQLENVASVPEPGVALLWLCGVGTVLGARRRAKTMSARKLARMTRR